jgi:nucleoside-diphosphate-sugar epimerase
MNVVITGGSGYLGNRLVKAMLGLGWNVTVLAQPGASRASLAAVQELVNIVETGDVGRAFESLGEFDVVVHTATCYGRNDEPASTIMTSNILFPMQVLECAVAHGATLFCNTDSALSRHVNSYGLSKKQFCEWLTSQACSSKTRVANVVLDQFYGPGESDDKFVTWIVRQCLKGGKIPLTIGTQKRRFLFIDDLVNGYLTAIKAAWQDSDALLQFRIASESEYPIREICEKVHAMTNSIAALNFGAIPIRNQEMDEEDMDLSAMRALGWREQISLEEGIALVVEYERGLIH